MTGRRGTDAPATARAGGHSRARRVDVSSAASTAGAVHEAVLYTTPDELAERLGPRLQASLGDDAPVVAVLDAPTRAEVRRVLGPDADRVAFPDPAAVHSLPPFTVAMRWARLSRKVRTPYFAFLMR